MWWWHPMLGLGIGFWVFWLLFRSLFWVLLIVFVVWMISRASGATPSWPRPPHRSNGLDILEQRYARGEIPREEYLQKKKDILAHDAS
jgi:putative membrane protein